MTAATSTAPVVLATIIANLQAANELVGVQVAYGDTANAERENVILTGNIVWDDETWADIGARSREEKYNLDGFVHVAKPGDSQQESTERVFAILAVLERNLRALLRTPDAGMTAALTAAYGAGAAQIVNLQIRPTKALGWAADEGQRYTIDFEIRVTARI